MLFWLPVFTTLVAVAVVVLAGHVMGRHHRIASEAEAIQRAQLEENIAAYGRSLPHDRDDEIDPRAR